MAVSRMITDKVKILGNATAPKERAQRFVLASFSRGFSRDVSMTVSYCCDGP